eukprot:ctg_1472.g349
MTPPFVGHRVGRPARRARASACVLRHRPRYAIRPAPPSPLSRHGSQEKVVQGKDEGKVRSQGGDGSGDARPVDKGGVQVQVGDHQRAGGAPQDQRQRGARGDPGDGGTRAHPPGDHASGAGDLHAGDARHRRVGWWFMLPAAVGTSCAGGARRRRRRWARASPAGPLPALG